MRTIRVALINLPALMRHIVEREFSNEPDFEVVPVAAAVATRPIAASPELDAVVVGDEGDTGLRGGSDVLQAWPRAKVLVVSGGGRDATLLTLRTHRTDLGHLNAQELVGAIRAALVSRNDQVP